ncbi:MAG: hypothetical protein L6R28_12325 [Planctomycetes bacterium]|nr:hypothetical protein [Planctomycetota bacterium]
MKLKLLVAVLGAIAVSCVTFETTVRASSSPAAADSRALATIVTLENAYMRFVTSHRVNKPMDWIQLWVRGIELLPGDDVGIFIVADNFIPLDEVPGLIMQGNPGGRLKGKTELGFAPFEFIKCKGTWTPRNKKLKLSLGKGFSEAFPVNIASGGGVFEFDYPISVGVWRNGDLFFFNGLYRVKIKNRGGNPITEKATLKAISTTFDPGRGEQENEN